MNINLISLAAVLLLVFSNGASAQKKPVEKALQRGLPLIVLPPSLAPFSAPIDCNATGTGCAVSIVILEGPINGVDACVANLPSEVRVHGTSSTAAERLMVWTLKLPVGLDTSFNNYFLLDRNPIRIRVLRKDRIPVFALPLQSGSHRRKQVFHVQRLAG